MESSRWSSGGSGVSAQGPDFTLNKCYQHIAGEAIEKDSWEIARDHIGEDIAQKYVTLANGIACLWGASTTTVTLLKTNIVASVAGLIWPLGSSEDATFDLARTYRIWTSFLTKPMLRPRERAMSQSNQPDVTKENILIRQVVASRA